MKKNLGMFGGMGKRLYLCTRNQEMKLKRELNKQDDSKMGV